MDYGGNMKKRVISIRNIFDGVMIFVLFIITAVYALPLNGVIYDNSNSGSSATNVSEAIDDLYSKLTTKDNEINRLKGLGNVASNQMLKGYTALVKGSVVTGTIPSKGATTYTPGTQNQTIASGNYLSGTQTIKGDANLVAGNIAKGKSIFGVTGSYTSDANATAADIAVGKTAYVNGNKITGTGGGAKVYTFKDVPVTMPSGITLKYGSWVSLAKKDETNYYSVDLGFTPAEVIACDIQMNGNYSATSDSKSGESFRVARGYVINSSTQSYFYIPSIKASKDEFIWYNNDNMSNWSAYSFQCKTSGNKLRLVVRNISDGTGGGISVGTRADQLTLSGTLVYR